MIKQRQLFIEQNEDSMRLVIFPEGVINNGKYALPFKKGAFESGLMVKPLVISYDFDIVSPQSNLPVLT